MGDDRGMVVSAFTDFLTIDSGRRRVSLDARNPGFYQNPNAVYAELHAQCPTFYWEEQRQWFFCGYDRVNSILRDRRMGRQILHVATRDELGMARPQPHVRHFDAAEAHSLLELEPPDHTRLRTMVNRAFFARNLEGMRSGIVELANRLIDGFEAEGRTDLLGAFANIIPVTMIARMIGIPEEMGPQLLKWSHDYVRMYMFGRTRADEDAADAAAKEFSDYVMTVVRERRKKPEDDLLSLMIHTEHMGKHLTDEELVSTTIVLLNAGHEATVHQIGNSVRAILESGHDPDSLFRDEASTARAVEEGLRVCAPVHIFQRWVLEPLALEGIEFRRGDRVSVILAAANLDPLKFSAPLEFQPERREAPVLSFGAGIHFCIGAPLARLELGLSLPILFRRLRGLRMVGPPVVSNIYHFHGLERLDVEWGRP